MNVHAGTMWTDQGALTGRAWDTLRVRTSLAPDCAILADVHVKHATPPPGSTRKTRPAIWSPEPAPTA